MYVKPAEARKHYKVSNDTLRRWAKNGRIMFKVTEGKHRRYFIPDPKNSQKIIYARVSSSKQKSNLENQVNFLKKKYPEYTLITDIGSGINFKRKGLWKILEQLFQGDVQEVVVTSSDRLTRFGFDLFKKIFHKFGSQLTVINADKYKSPQEELAEDLLSIVTIFTAKHHGQRRYKIEDDEDKDISE